MNSLIIKSLEPIRLPILKKLYKAHYPSTKIKGGEHIFVAENATSIVGVVRFRNIDKWQLLTGMMVVPDARRQGIASRLLQYCQSTMLNENVYCFAYVHLQQMYSAYGFRCIDIEALPASLQKLYLRYTQAGKPLIIMQYCG
ncbi:GNAT family N-acetyltransferase [Vibrio ezurae]|uniref:Putative acetyltransferase n=1 Tax=Vibrio ezurae NBRC 102218 TaxID=1219080 RepID=U3CJX6_9VIBR|nr:GNAT family N-acetyltransferase [Vibrio ezurae]GAD81429.1 putative acetyltransferase [Vibrio ezurae NBRC 102218]